MSATLSVSTAPELEPIAPLTAVRACPLCGESRATLLHRLADPSGRIAGTFDLRRCAGCGAGYVDPRPSDALLTSLYGDDFYFSTGWSYRTLAAWTIELIQARRRARVERRVPRGRVLDVGSGDGSFVHHMARHGWDATGIDFSPAALDFARSTPNGGRFVLGTLDDYDGAPERFDVITLWQVLEHIGEPRTLLRRCHELLRRDGLLVAAVPNLDGLSARLTGARWWGLDVPRHLVLYTPAALGAALADAGFHVERIRHRSLQYDPYALLHSTLDWTFTRRHFLSDLAKRHAVARMGRLELAYNLAVLATLGPLLAPLALATTSAGALAGHGGFIEVHARRR